MKIFFFNRRDDFEFITYKLEILMLLAKYYFNFLNIHYLNKLLSHLFLINLIENHLMILLKNKNTFFLIILHSRKSTFICEEIVFVK